MDLVNYSEEVFKKIEQQIGELTEEDFKILEESVKVYQKLPKLFEILEKNKDEKTIKLLEDVLKVDINSLKKK